MEDYKYVKLTDVQEVLDLIETRDQFYSWSESFEKYDKKVKEAIIVLESKAIVIE